MVFSFPGGFRKLLRTTNGVERFHREVRRRARVVSIFQTSHPVYDWFRRSWVRSVKVVNWQNLYKF